MTISKTKQHTVRQYYLSYPIECVACYKYLGSYFTEDLPWSYHIHHIRKKAP